jgi:hypothetical protein
MKKGRILIHGIFWIGWKETGGGKTVIDPKNYDSRKYYTEKKNK